MSGEINFTKVKIREKSVEIWAKCLKTIAKLLYVLWFYKSGTPNQSADVLFVIFFWSCFYFVLFGQVWRKFVQKWCLKCLDLKKCAQHENERSRFFWKVIFFGVFWASLGKFGKKSFTPPKICLLLHLCLEVWCKYIWNSHHPCQVLLQIISWWYPVWCEGRYNDFRSSYKRVSLTIFHTGAIFFSQTNLF